MTYERHPFSQRYHTKAAAVERVLHSIRMFGYDADRPIRLFQGMVLDGWHRYLAACKAGVEPVYKEFEGSEAEAVSLIFRENVARRTMSMTAMCIALLDQNRHGANLSDARIMELVGCKSGTFQKAKRTFGEMTDEEREDVGAGTKPFSAADPNPRRTYTLDKKDIVKIKPLAESHGLSFEKEYKACLRQGIAIREADLRAQAAREVG